ncbi:hypothetical protein [Oscillatoria acuminata]|uniref:Uncharacterized protein n=1 Tax=Oscillatoria acuminata PCC 6304 TaxID=56110 RepID=K9TB85_9CYAN|nr:hypothetical protein [Oscillatoria acuminata]AFY80162.1 hypothetical protein Oscil6304_0412 [Oscillatoria acuminata PCC 6304]
MTAIILGTGGTIQSPDGNETLENFIFRLIKLGQARERDTSLNPSGTNKMTSSLSDDPLSGSFNTALFTASVDLSAKLTRTGTDRFKVETEPYLNAGFSSGTGGTFASNFWAQDLADAILMASDLQRATDYTIYSWRIEPSITTGEFNARVNMSVNNAPIILTATDTGELASAQEFLA